MGNDRNGIGLSKSRYCRGIQCPKMLWMDKYMPDKAEDVLSESVMATGNMVGDLARNYFGSYDLVEFDYDKDSMAEKTRRLMETGSDNIAEAAFYVDGLYCAVDILHKDGDGYDIVEVKSSTHVADIYLEDMAFQYYVLSRCCVNVKKVKIMYLDNTYPICGFVLNDEISAARNDPPEVLDAKIAKVEQLLINLQNTRDTQIENDKNRG